MKKIIISVLALLALTSCGTPKIENPNDALKQNQEAVFENLENLVNLTPNEGNSKWNLALLIDTKEWVIKSDIKYDFNFIQKEQKSEWNIKINLDLNIKDKNIAPIEKISWNIDLNLISLKNKALFKLNELKINDIEKNPQLAMITWMVAPFQKKWYFIDLPKNPNTPFDQELLLKNQKEIVKILKKHTIFEFVKENQNKDFYDYDIKLNSKNIVLIYKKIYKLIEKDWEVNKEEILNVEETIKKINSEIKSNIKINKKDLELFILTLENKNWNLKIENKKDELNFIFNDNESKLNIIFNWKKLSKKLEAKINITEKWEKLFNWNINIEVNWKNTKVVFNWIANSNWEELKINFSINDKTIEKNIKIEEPKEAKNFQEVIQGFMWAMMWGTSWMWIQKPQFQIEQPKIDIEK